MNAKHDNTHGSHDVTHDNHGDEHDNHDNKHDSHDNMNAKHDNTHGGHEVTHDNHDSSAIPALRPQDVQYHHCTNVRPYQRGSLAPSLDRPSSDSAIFSTGHSSRQHPDAIPSPATKE